MSALEARLGHVFRDRDLLQRALTHASANAAASNERLEFLGDRVLGLVIAEKLHTVAKIIETAEVRAMAVTAPAVVPLAETPTPAV